MAPQPAVRPFKGMVHMDQLDDAPDPTKPPMLGPSAALPPQQGPPPAPQPSNGFVGPKFPTQPGPPPPPSVPGMEKLGGTPPPVPQPPKPLYLQTPAEQQRTIQQVRREVAGEVEHPETAPLERRFGARVAGKISDQPDWTIDDLSNLALMVGTEGVGSAAEVASNPAVRKTASAISRGLGAYFSAGMAKGGKEHAQQALEAYRKGDYLNAVRLLGAGSTEAGMGLLGLRGTLRLADKSAGLAPQQAEPTETAAKPVVPESKGTLKIQADQLTSNQRRAVMVPRGADMPKVPKGMQTYTDANGNTFIYNPQMTSTQQIDAASANNQLPALLGPAEGGMGAPDKSVLQGKPTVAVVAKNAKGETAQGTLTDRQNMPQAVTQAQKVTPPGGKVEIERPQDVINDGKELTRGDSDIPMTDDGRTSVQKHARTMAPVDRIYHGPLQRTAETAQIYAQAQPKQVPVMELPGTEPWRLGALAGIPLEQTEGLINHLMKDAPDVAAPGVGPLSPYPGESHNQFVDRFLHGFQPVLEDYAAHPNDRIMFDTHSRNLRVLNAWTENGTPADMSLNKAALDKPVPEPGQSWLMREGPNGKLKIIDDDGGPGVVLARHGETEWNGPEGAKIAGDETTRPAMAGGPGTELPAAAEGTPGRQPAPAQKRPPGNTEVQTVANAYNAQQGLPPVDHSQYHPVDENFGRRVADAYDALQEDNSNDPRVRAAYQAFVRETKAQWDHLVANGYKLEPWTQPGQPYANSREMVADVRNNKHLYFFTGGEPHPFLSAIDPDTGLSYNDEFRAVHDVMGHAAAGYGFGPRGEEGAHDVHSQSFSPLAREAMTTETRGQNSWVNFGRQNYDAEGNPLHIPATEKPYATQKVDLLPPEFQTRAGERYAQAAPAGDWLDQQADAARNRIAQRWNEVSRTLSLNPVEFVAKQAGDYAILGAQKIRQGYQDFKAWSDQMVNEVGEAIRPHLEALWGPSNEIHDRVTKDVKRRSMEDLDVRIPDAVRVASADPRKTITGADFHSLPLEQPAEGFLPYRVMGPERANEAVLAAWNRSIRASEGEGGTAAADAVRATGARPPDAAFWDKAFSLPQKARYWYELSGEAFLKKYMSLPAEMARRVIDAVAGTSGGVEPGPNLQRGIGILSEQLQNQPVMVDLRDPGSARQALNPEKDLSTLKYGNFSGTMQYLAGLTNKKPLTTNDVQVGSMFGIKGEDIAKNPVLYEVLSRFFLEMRDLQNSHLPEGAQPWETWQMQAPSWVYERIRKNPRKAAEYDDYSAVFPNLIQKLQNAGVPTPGGKITMETLMDPRTPNVMSGTREHFLGSPTGTVEVATTQTPAGSRAARLFDELRKQDQSQSWVGQARDRYEQIQRNAMSEFGERIKKQPSLVSQLMSAIVGRKIEVSRIDTGGYGTFEGKISPNIRIPLTGRYTEKQQARWMDLDDTQKRAFLSILGQELKQDAMAWSHFRTVEGVPAEGGLSPGGDSKYTASVFLERYDKGADPKAIEDFSRKLGFPVNVVEHPNGTLIDINVGGMGGRRPDPEMVRQLTKETWGNDPAVKDIGLFSREYAGDYLTQDKYQGAIDQHYARTKVDDAGRARPARDTARINRDIGRIRKELRGISLRRDAAFAKWADATEQSLRQKTPQGIRGRAAAQAVGPESETPTLEGLTERRYGQVSPEKRLNYAEGGIVSRPTDAIVGEAGPELVQPLAGNSKSNGKLITKPSRIPLGGKNGHAVIPLTGSPASRRAAGYLTSGNLRKERAKNEITRLVSLRKFPEATNFASKSVRKGHLRDDDVDHALDRAELGGLRADFKRLSPRHMPNVLAVASPEERRALLPDFRSKMDSEFNGLPDTDQDKVLQQLSTVLSPQEIQSLTQNASS
jgi:broad specificity phosphatase PhoE